MRGNETDGGFIVVRATGAVNLVSAIGIIVLGGHRAAHSSVIRRVKVSVMSVGAYQIYVLMPRHL